MTDSRVSKVSKSPEGIERLRIREDLEVNLLRVAAGPSDNPTELAKRLVALVSTGSAMVDQIAAVILARKAIITLKERFRSHLIEPVGDEAAGSDEAVRAKVVSAIGELDQVFIDALQAFCTKLLRERALGGTQEGFSWSGMIHGVLAAAAVEIPSGILRNTCKDILSEYANPTDKSWESRGLVELDQALETVCTSELWARARNAEKLVVEVPLSLQHRGAVSAENYGSSAQDSSESLFRRQIDMFPGEDGPDNDDPSEVRGKAKRLGGFEGIVDLAFREEGSWVIVDYKTDLFSDVHLDSELEDYRQQVDLYSDAWIRLTGDLVKERVLFFTAQDHLESW